MMIGWVSSSQWCLVAVNLTSKSYNNISTMQKDKSLISAESLRFLNWLKIRTSSIESEN